MNEEKARIAITIDPDLLDWIDEMIKTRKFASRSHAIGWCVNEEKGKQGNANATPCHA